MVRPVDISPAWLYPLNRFADSIQSQAAPSAASTTTTAPTAPGSGKLVFISHKGGYLYRQCGWNRLRLLTRGGLDPALFPNGQQVALMGADWGFM
jgi:hypothetical protein